MFLSKRSNGRYYIFYDNSNGKRTCISTRTTKKSEALKFLSNFEKELKERESKKTIPITLTQFKNQYLRYSATVHSINHTKSIRTSFNELIKGIGDIYLSELNKNRLQSYLEERLRKVSPYAVRRDIINFSSSFNWGINKNYLSENYCKGIKKPKLPERLPHFFSEDEFQKLIEIVDDTDLKDLIEFAVLTGLRQSDLISLRWSQIDFKNNNLILDNRNSLTKSRKVHNIPLSISALQILTKRDIKREDKELVFTYLGKKIRQTFISKRFSKYVEEANINKKLTFHSLRHTFASWLVQKGVSIYQVSKLMTHSDPRVTQIYSHLRSEDLRNSINLLTTN